MVKQVNKKIMKMAKARSSTGSTVVARRSKKHTKPQKVHTVGKYRNHKMVKGRRHIMAAFARYWKKHKAAIIAKYPNHKPGVLKNRARRHFAKEYGVSKKHMKRRGHLRRRGHTSKYASFVKKMYPVVKKMHPEASRKRMFQLIAAEWRKMQNKTAGPYKTIPSRSHKKHSSKHKKRSRTPTPPRRSMRLRTRA